MVHYPKDVDLKMSELLGSKVSVDLWSQQIPADQYSERDTEKQKTTKAKVELMTSDTD